MMKVSRLHLHLVWAAAVLLAVFYALTKLSASRIEGIANLLGPAGPVLVISCIVVTQVVAFISTTPAILAGVRMYGYGWALILFYIGTMISSAINFVIARRYGASVIRKLVGRDNLKLVMTLSVQEETWLLVSARIFGYFFCDAISYAIGLTTVPFVKYMLYTAIITPIPITIEYLVFRRINFASLPELILYYGSLAMTGAVFLFVLLRSKTKA
jgi:uncharacterized membrane protein YdjX (TVP38/TMEM64 family)